MRRIPSFHALRAFEAAARLGSFARASEELHLTPSAVSHQIRALERWFGRGLFRRANRQATLTSDGQRLLAGLSNAFDTIEAVCAELSPPPPSSLAVHCTPSFAAKWLGPRLPAFVETHPGIAIRLSTSADPVDLGRHEEIDILIAYGRPPRGPGLTVVSLGPEEIAALCTPRVARAAGSVRRGTLEQFTRLDSSFSPVRWPDWFAHNGLPAPVGTAGAAFDRGSLVISAAVQGLGVALETLRFAHDEVEAGQLVRLGGDRLRSLHRDLHFICYRERDGTLEKIQAFRRWLLDVEEASRADRPAASA
ncbi:DNA-binding transcriptional LysR family regulator [Methylobacterium brachiatum]|uniref:DNA-binding transcriptional LysR family regulator n=1 Tax=Methylobacterium brachiatum TaxID=269660 RepID=A0AAJ1TZR9_9HYPH|nr:LysR substrate-binding domain-containing protein [Methylobacterium brachiatum]MCB4806163.1 LysR family transcriptional regulator [Methylobacterium brachiatum]MDQ0546617.1 DNA-binding transcriptional LysR family regulator [Methylobacterium brachiatum]